METSRAELVTAGPATAVAVEPWPVARLGLLELLRDSGLAPAAAVASLQEVPVRPRAPDVLVLSLGRGPADLRPALEQFRAHAAACRVLAFLADGATPEHGLRLLPLVDAVLLDPTPDRVKRALQWVRLGYRYFDGTVPEAVWNRMGSTGGRGPDGGAKQVLKLLAAGRTDAEIAAELGCSVAAAKARVRAVLRSSGARNRAEAVARALREGWIE